MLQRNERVGSREVREYLGSALPASEVEDVSRELNGAPLLLLTMPQLVAGFGFTGRDVEREYGGLYEAFRRQYEERRADWDRLELAFVVCVPEDSPGLGLFGSSVETDVFFCRKYVVPLNGKPVGKALARLPFVPLFVDGEETGRPPSAQTFLRQCGVPAPLARHVVVKGERSATTIVEDCIRGEVERPRAPSREDKWESPVVPHKSVEMRIASLEIENFRAYRKKQTIDFGKDLTVLYGPNGFGKTSVYDAVDFAFTGDIGRLKIRDEDGFRNVANHLDGNGSEGVVRLGYSMAGEPHSLVRHVNDRKWARVDGIRASRKSVLEELTGWKGATVDRVDNMVNLFRATHLFSQEHQELARDFRRKCELSAEVVSSLLAFEDYQAGRNKLSQVCGVLRKGILTLDSERDSLREEVAADEAELESVGRAAEGGATSPDWEDAVSSLYERVEDEGLAVPSGMPQLETLRGWRMTFGTRAAELREEIDGLVKCLAVVEQLPRKQADLAALTRRVEGAKDAVADASIRRDQAEERHRAGAEKMSFVERGLAELNAGVEKLAWLEESVPRYVALAREEGESRDRLSVLRRSVEEAEGRQMTLSELIDEQEAERSDVLGRTEETVGKLERARELLAGLEEWDERRTRMREVVAQQMRAVESIEALGLSESTLLDTIEALEREQKALAYRVSVQDERQSELSELVMQIESHIEGGVVSRVRGGPRRPREAPRPDRRAFG